MIKHTIMALCCLLFSVASWCQVSHSKTGVQKTTNQSTRQTTRSLTQHNNVEAPKSLLNVIFATNEDCDLYINNEAKGFLSKKDFRTLKLTAGKYHYKVIATATGDELKDSFSVRNRGSNSVFIDLLYVVNANKILAQKDTTAIVPEKATEQQPEETKTEGVVGLLLSNMLPISGGKFVMGNNKAHVSNEVEHTVTVSPFLFSKYEVTQDQWQTIMGYNPSFHKDCGTCPVENISWDEAVHFIQKLNAVSNRKFRLPTEAEWEFVAKLGGKKEIEEDSGEVGYIKQTAWYFGNANEKTHPVANKKPSAAGIYDLTGNISEWCQDWYDEEYYHVKMNHLNPTGPWRGTEKVIRGGNFKDYVGDRFRPSFRNKMKPTEKAGEVGFRLAMDKN